MSADKRNELGHGHVLIAGILSLIPGLSPILIRPQFLASDFARKIGKRQTHTLTNKQTETK